jgi:EpsI family protein
LRVNRALIQLGDERQLVYYWFQQRGRAMTNEYLVKWFLFWDALVRNRTDGALVRLTTPVAPGEDPAAADAVLELFARSAVGSLEPYIPR